MFFVEDETGRPAGQGHGLVLAVSHLGHSPGRPPPAGGLPKGRSASGETTVALSQCHLTRRRREASWAPGHLPEENLVSAPSRVCDWLTRGASTLFTLWAT